MILLQSPFPVQGHCKPSFSWWESQKFFILREITEVGESDHVDPTPKSVMSLLPFPHAEVLQEAS